MDGGSQILMLFSLSSDHAMDKIYGWHRLIAFSCYFQIILGIRNMVEKAN